MKKRMFITTIVMMLVLAVALTTSSLAWFSSANITVTASSATFTATTAGSSNVNLKIGDTVGGWGNEIALTSGSGRSMDPLIPTAPLIATEKGDPIKTTGVTRQGATSSDIIKSDVYHQGYVWPATMSFNGVKINGGESTFVIDANNEVTDKSGLAVNSSDGYYYDEFYLLNADSQNSINRINFKVNATLSNMQVYDATLNNGAGGYKNVEEEDYTARGYVAFIIFDLVNVPAFTDNIEEEAEGYQSGIIPSNALENAGLRVRAYGTENPESNDITESADGAGINVWIPFAAFSFCTDTSGTFEEQAWQFANFNDKNGITKMTQDEYIQGTFYTMDGQIVSFANNDAASTYYAGVVAGTKAALYTTRALTADELTAIKTEAETNSTSIPKFYSANGEAITFTAEQFAAYLENYDSTDPESESADLYGYYKFFYHFKSTDSLKTQPYDALTGGDGYTLNQANLRALNSKGLNESGNVVANGSSNLDNSSEFIMKPGEIWRVAMYYWLDGQSVTEYTDTTVSTIDLVISVPQT